jgi:hypothetical protein
MSWVGETGEAKAERSRLSPFPSLHRFQILMSFHVFCCGTLAVSLEAISRLWRDRVQAPVRVQSFSIGGGKKLRRTRLAFAQAAAISAFDFRRDKQPPCASPWRAIAVERSAGGRRANWHPGAAPSHPLPTSEKMAKFAAWTRDLAFPGASYGRP